MNQTSQVYIRELSEGEYGRWTRFVAESETGSVYALPAYLRALCRVTSRSFSILGAFRGDNLVGGMAMYMGKTEAGLVSADHHLLFYHSPVIRDYTTKYAHERTARQFTILAALEQHLRHHACDHLVLYMRHSLTDLRPFNAGGWRIVPRYTYLVTLDHADQIWNRMAPYQRHLVEKAMDQGVTCCDDGDFSSFYAHHLKTCRKKGLKPYLPEPAFHSFYQELKAENLCRLYHARLTDGRNAASLLVLGGPHPVSHTLCAASDPDFHGLGVNPFLRWAVFNDLMARGYTANDLSGAPLNDVARFKRQLGGDLVVNWQVIRPVSAGFYVRREMVKFRKRVVSRIRRTFGRGTAP